MKKTLRFEVFKRDGFVCQYCGGSPPDKILEVDHIIPKAKGGKDEINNLVTSCFDCNRGKRDRELGTVPTPLSVNIEVLQEKERQYKEYRKLLKNIDRRINDEIDEVQAIFQQTFTESQFTPRFRSSVKMFINSLNVETVKDAMWVATSKKHSFPEYCLQYFCGICWNRIRGNNG